MRPPKNSRTEPAEGHHPRRLIIGISGASGIIYGVRALELLQHADVETHLVMSKSAEMTLAYEADLQPAALRALASKHYQVSNIGAAISSGSFPDADLAVLGSDDERDRHRRHEFAVNPCCRRRPERAAQFGPRSPRNTFACRSPAHHDATCRNGGHRGADCSGLLQPSSERCRYRKSHRGPIAGFVWH